MSHFKDKEHKIRFWPGFRPRLPPAGRAYSGPSDPTLDLRGPASKRREGTDRVRDETDKGKEKGMKGEGREK